MCVSFTFTCIKSVDLNHRYITAYVAICEIIIYQIFIQFLRKVMILNSVINILPIVKRITKVKLKKAQYYFMNDFINYTYACILSLSLFLCFTYMHQIHKLLNCHHMRPVN